MRTSITVCPKSVQQVTLAERSFYYHLSTDTLNKREVNSMIRNAAKFFLSHMRTDIEMTAGRTT